MRIFVCLYSYVALCIFNHICTKAKRKSISTPISIYIYVYIYIYIYVYIHIYIYMHISMCVSMYAQVVFQGGESVSYSLGFGEELLGA